MRPAARAPSDPSGPAVSVIVPTYQRRELVQRAVASVLAQTHRDFELIVIDDGSTDGTAEALAPLAGRLVYRWQPNSGVSAARNAGLRLARGSIVAFLDSDNRWLRDHLQAVFDALAENPGAILAVTRPWSITTPRRGAGEVRLTKPLARLLIGNYVGWVSGVALRRDAIAEVGGFDERLRVTEDNDLWLRLAVRGGCFALLDRRTVVPQVTRGSLIQSLRRGDYVAQLEASTARMIADVERREGEWVADLLPEMRGRAQFLRALRALNEQDDEKVRKALAAACELLPALSSRPISVLNHLRFNQPVNGVSRREHSRQLATIASLWPDRDAETPLSLLAHALLTALAAGRLTEAATHLSRVPSGALSPFALRIWPQAFGRAARQAAHDGLHRGRSAPVRSGASRGGDVPRIVRLAHRSMLRFGQGPLAPVWRLGHEALATVLGAYLSRGEDGASVYLKGGLVGRDALYGLSDIDTVIVVAPDRAHPGRAAERVRHRWDLLARRLPSAAELIFEPPGVFEEDELAATVAATTFTHDLYLEAPAVAVQDTRPAARERARERAGAERPGLFGPGAEWRRLRGPERRPPCRAPELAERRMVAWMELQFWWLQAFRGCLNPSGPRAAYLCVKLLSEPARIWLWLARGERIVGRREVLHRAIRELPEEERALRRALDLLGELPNSPPAPLGDALASLLRMSGRIATLLAGEVAEAGATDVRLRWGGPDELVFPEGAGTGLGDMGHDWAPARMLPLADWRARVWWSVPPDECFRLVPADPTEPATIAAAAGLGDDGVYAGLRAGGLVVMPSLRRARLRAVQCELTDPVTLALVADRALARFPEVPGWSARDSARRGVAEHLGWLREEPIAKAGAHALGRLFTAARAALFLESLDAGLPELALTVAAVAERLDQRSDPEGRLAREAYGAYRGARVEGDPLPADLFHAFRSSVSALYPYAGADGD